MKVETHPNLRLSLVRVFGDLVKADIDRAKTIEIERDCCGVPFFLNALNSSDEEAVNVTERKQNKELMNLNEKR